MRAAESPAPSMESIGLLRRERRRPPGPGVARVADLSIPGETRLRARLYRSSTAAQPLTVFAHGGGFVFGGLESHDRLCRRMSLLGGTAVLAVDYRLAPEHPAPAAVDDVVRALEWVATAPEELGPVYPGAGLAGDSAGGLIAFLAARRLAGTPAEPCLLLLAYPNADLTLSQSSTRSKGEGWGLSIRDLAFNIEQWLPHGSPEALAEFSPVDIARTQPFRIRTLLATAEHDPLRDEGRLLAGLLIRRGADVEYCPHPGLVHGFLTLDTVSPAAARAGDGLLRRYGQILRQQTSADAG